MVLAIRDGTPVITVPTHDGGQVPEDFLVLLGVASTFQDPQFRSMMMAICRAASENGYLDGIISSPDRRAN